MAQASEPDSYDDELARIDASIAELKIQDMKVTMSRSDSVHSEARSTWS